ncbi:unnamed protein product, partial [Dovyalis caffra]
AWNLWKEDKAMELLDQTLSKTCNINEFVKCVNVGLLCVQEDPSDRPTISNILFMLGTETPTLPDPKQPAFVVRRCQSSRASASSSNEDWTNRFRLNVLGPGAWLSAGLCYQARPILGFLGFKMPIHVCFPKAAPVYTFQHTVGLKRGGSVQPSDKVGKKMQKMASTWAEKDLTLTLVLNEEVRINHRRNLREKAKSKSAKVHMKGKSMKKEINDITVKEEEEKLALKKQVCNLHETFVAAGNNISSLDKAIAAIAYQNDNYNLSNTIVIVQNNIYNLNTILVTAQNNLNEAFATTAAQNT